MRYILLFMIFIVNPVPVAAADLSSTDFAFGYALNVDGDGAIASLVIPDEVYRVVKMADLGDMRVLNAAGEIVPHYVRQPSLPDKAQQTRTEVPFFSLHSDQVKAGELNLGVRLEKTPQGTTIQLDTRESPASRGQNASSYLFDLSGVKTEVRGIELSWSPGELSAATVSLQQSDDLTHWSPLVDRAVLVDLEHQGQRIVQPKIHLPRNPLKYVRMNSAEGTLPFILQKVTVFSGAEPARLPRHWLALDKGRFDQQAETSIVYHSPAPLPVNGVRLRFPEVNGILRATVQSRPDDKSPWISRCSGVFYVLQVEGDRLGSELCALAETADQHWRLAVVQDGVGLEKSERLPVLELGWTPAELLFVSRGPAPYTLAFGSGRLEREKGPVGGDMIQQALASEDQKILIRPAVLGKRLELGGEKALADQPAPLPWKKWSLWLTLGAGVVFMGLMVWKLSREMRRQD